WRLPASPRPGRQPGRYIVAEADREHGGGGEVEGGDQPGWRGPDLVSHRIEEQPVAEKQQEDPADEHGYHGERAEAAQQGVTPAHVPHPEGKPATGVPEAADDVAAGPHPSGRRPGGDDRLEYVQSHGDHDQGPQDAFQRVQYHGRYSLSVVAGRGLGQDESVPVRVRESGEGTPELLPGLMREVQSPGHQLSVSLLH